MTELERIHPVDPSEVRIYYATYPPVYLDLPGGGHVRHYGPIHCVSVLEPGNEDKLMLQMLDGMRAKAAIARCNAILCFEIQIVLSEGPKPPTARSVGCASRFVHVLEWPESDL